MKKESILKRFLYFLLDRSDLDHIHQVSYDIAKGFLTEEIEQKWLNLVREMTDHD